MALYTYDEEADALYVLLAPEPDAAIERTILELKVPFRFAA